MLTANITKYVRLAFDQSGDLVKKLTIVPNDSGAFVPSTGKYTSTATDGEKIEVEALDDKEDETIDSDSFSDRSMRKYIVLSPSIIKVGYTFIDDALSYTISKLMPIQQNSVVFVYSMWAET